MLSPGVFAVPEYPTTADQSVMSSDHDREARTRRAVPIRLDAIDSSGIATWPGVAPAPALARVSQSARAGMVSTGNSGRVPRRSSKIDRSGSGHETGSDGNEPASAFSGADAGACRL